MNTSDVLLWITTHRRTSVGRPARIYFQQFCADTGNSLEALPWLIDDRDGCEGVKELRAAAADDDDDEDDDDDDDDELLGVFC